MSQKNNKAALIESLNNLRVVKNFVSTRNKCTKLINYCLLVLQITVPYPTIKPDGITYKMHHTFYELNYVY